VYQAGGTSLASKKNKSSKRRGKRGGATNLSPNAISYSGPITVPGAMRGEEVFTQLCSEIVDLAFPGGAFTTIFTQFRSFGTTTPYTDSYAVYGEYRCLGMEAHFVPLYQPVQTDVSAAPNSGWLLASSIEKTPNGTAFAGTTLLAMTKNSSLELHRAFDSFKRVVKMNGTEEAAWSPTAVAAVSQFSVGIIADTRATCTPANEVFGTVIVHRLMQWRNRLGG